MDEGAHRLTVSAESEAEMESSNLLPCADQETLAVRRTTKCTTALSSRGPRRAASSAPTSWPVPTTRPRTTRLQVPATPCKIQLISDALQLLQGALANLYWECPWLLANEA